MPQPKDARGIPVCDLLTPEQLTALGLVPQTATERRDEPFARCTWAVAAEPGDRAGVATRIPTEVPALVGYYRIRDSYADFEPITVSGHPGFRYAPNPKSGCVYGIAIADYQYLDTDGSVVNAADESGADPLRPHPPDGGDGAVQPPPAALTTTDDKETTMPGGYPGTSFDFLGAPEEAFGVLDGPGHVPVSEASQMYRGLSRAFVDAAAKIRSAARVLVEANEGAAGDAARTYLVRLAVVGDEARAEADLATEALYDQADQVAMVRTEVEAAQQQVAASQELGATADLSITASANANLRDAAQQAAGEAGNLHQTNVNHNYSAAFQPFEPPPAAPVDTSAGPTTARPDWGSGGRRR